VTTTHRALGTLLDSVSCRKALLNADRLDLQAPDRRALDEVVFDMLGLTAAAERLEAVKFTRSAEKAGCDLPQVGTWHERAARAHPHRANHEDRLC
jgi:hypothetical protein